MNQKRKKKIPKFIILITLISILILSSSVWLPLPATFLLVGDNIQKADCIVPLGGDLYLRFQKAIELYNKGYARKIAVSVLPKLEKEFRMILSIYGVENVSPKELTLKAFKYFGKSPQDIYFTEGDVTSTFEEAVATKEFMIKNGLKSFILVTSGYHMRRALMIFRRVFKGTGIKIYNCTVQEDLFNPYRWWLKESDIKIVLQEYLSIAHNYIYHFLLKKKRTSFDSF